MTEMSRRLSGYLQLGPAGRVAFTAALLGTLAFFVVRQLPTRVGDVAEPAHPATIVPGPPEPSDGAASDDALTGQYSLGAGASRAALTLSRSGTFTMSSASVLAMDRKVSGQWRVDGSKVVLWYNNKGRLHRWALETIARGDSIDLVPEELVAIYKENPRNIGARYQRVSRLVPSERQRPAGSANSTKASRSTEKDRIAGNSTSHSRDSVAAPKEMTKTMAAPPQRQEDAESDAASPAGESGGFDFRAFVYKPPPQVPIQLNRVSGPGLARLKINERGEVTDVTILRSTGHKASDLETSDTLRRWRAKPGEPREVELPLIWWIAGKRAPR